LRIGDAMGRAEDAKELVALAADTAEHSPLLEDHGPGHDGEEKKKQKNAARDPARLREDAADIGCKNR
jgi:hypothetical protein